MAKNHEQYNHQDEPKAEVEATDRGLFGLVGKKEEEKRCDGEVIAAEFDEKVEVSEEKKQESKEQGGLLQKLHRSTSSSSSSSEEEGREGGEKKKKKGLKEKCDDKPAQETEEKKGFLDKIKVKLPAGKKAEDATPARAAEGATSPRPEKKGFMDKMKEKIPGYSKTGDEKEGAYH